MSTPFDSFSNEQDGDLADPAQNAEEVQPVPPGTELDPSGETLLSSPETPAEVSIDPLISTLPPEAQGETNGGPLGCCLGSVAGLFLTLAVVLLVSVSLGNGGYLGWATGPVALLGTIGGGYAGWLIGKRIYREYELSPRRRERLELVEQQWRSREARSRRTRRTKME